MAGSLQAQHLDRQGAWEGAPQDQDEVWFVRDACALDHAEGFP